MVAQLLASRTLGLATCLVVFSILAVALRLRAPATLDRLFGFATSRTAWVLTSVVVLIGFAVVLAASTAFPGYIDHAEANIASVSWLLAKGQPLYHSLDSASRYSLLYGPTSYLPYAFALSVFGGSIFSLKGLIVVANVGMLFFLWRAYRTLFDPLGALLTAVLVLLIIFVPRPNHYLFQVRADVLIMSAAALGLFGASSRREWLGPACLAIAAAFVSDTKATGFVYILPLFALFYSRRGWRALATVLLCTGALSALPFLLPNVSLTHYLEWIHEAKGHPASVMDLVSTLRTLPILLAPLLLILGPTPWQDPGLVQCLRENRVVLATLAVCFSLAVAASSRIGAGAHHVLPFVPLLGYECALLYKASNGDFGRRWPWLSRYLWASLSVLAMFRIGGGLIEIKASWDNWRWYSAVNEDIDGILTRYPAREVQMGYGDAEPPITFFRPALVFQSNHLLLDVVALSDMNLDGIALPVSTVEAIDTCAVDVWLIPKGTAPFTLNNPFASFYPQLVSQRPLFDMAFQGAFARRYTKDESTPYFDLWTCHKSPAGLAASRGSSGT